MSSIFSVSHKLLCTLAACAALLLTGGLANAQSTKGKVLDAQGEPIVGASVVVPGTTTGVVTDLDGNFELRVAPGTTLEVSCIGYTTVQVAAAANLTVTLQDDAEMLEETVVIGYGTVKVRDLTGSVAAVGEKDLAQPVANVGEALQGKLAGVVVSLNDGTPGAEPQIRIRGAKSITQTNNPLYIIDGFPASSLANVPSDQIKSINVLKDAAATAIYGSRGASGVVIVTTKSAFEGQTQVTYNGFVQIKDSSMNVRDVMDTYDYLKFTIGYAWDYNQAMGDKIAKYFGIGAANGNHYADYAKVQTHNWQSDLYKTAIAHSHNLTISNGTKKNRTIFSLNFLNDDGTVINSWYQRINASLKTVENLTDNFNVELNVNYAYSNRRSNPRLAEAFRYKPILNPLGDETSFDGFGAGLDSYISDAANPVEQTLAEQNTSYGHVFRAIAAANWTPIEGLKLRSELGLGKNFSKTENYTEGYGNMTNSASLNRSESSDLHWTNTVSYEIPFADKSVNRADLMVGQEYIGSSSDWMQYYAQVFPSHFDRERTLAMLSQGTTNNAFTQNVGVPGRSLSFFARANYALYDRYLFTATFRADGSSRFAPNNRWGYFPAAAFAWRAIDEPWMAGTHDWLSNLKFRLSYGVTGSDAINANLWRETWALGTSASAYTISSDRSDTNSGYGYSYAPGSMMQNPDLKWESTITRNAGVDFGFWDDRLYGTLEGYWSTTYDLLMPVSVNAATGYSYQYQNMGVVANRGLELSLGGDIVRTGDFSLSANFIYNYNVNKIEKLSDSVTSNTYGQWVNSEHRPSVGEYFLKEGYAIGSIVGYAYEGWYTTDDFNYENGIYTLKEGIPDWAEDSYFNRFTLASGQKAFPGAAKVKDQDGSRTITTADTYVIGEMTPRSTGSFSLSGRWKNLDFGANFNYVIGGKILNYWGLSSLYGAKDNMFGGNRLAFVADAYSPYRWNNGELEFVSDPAELDKMNANATMHSPTSMVGMLFDKWIEDASYLRLKNLTIGYTLPKNWVSKIGLKNLRAYFTATNLLTFTKYTGLDPEVNTNRSGSYGFPTPGVDRGAYPIAKTFTFGVNVTL
ncbi:MAG: TonB-dependent receptor [Bacteroidales bacterium]|nr:TonB-dependent receptor [Bacteroidales bacterium]